jgi:hypothetical protein
MTKNEFAIKIMAQLWIHFWKPADDLVCKALTDDYYKVFSHYADEQLLAAVDLMIRQHDGRGGIPKIVQFFRYIPSLSDDRLLAAPKVPACPTPVGISQYIAMAGRMRGGSYIERLARATEQARDDGACEATIAVLESALKGE